MCVKSIFCCTSAVCECCSLFEAFTGQIKWSYGSLNTKVFTVILTKIQTKPLSWVNVENIGYRSFHLLHKILLPRAIIFEKMERLQYLLTTRAILRGRRKSIHTFIKLVKYLLICHECLNWLSSLLPVTVLYIF